MKASIDRKVLLKDADNYAVWIGIDKRAETGTPSEKLSLLKAEIQAVCNDHLSTLDDTLSKKLPRPNPTPHVFVEQGNELSQILWLRWEP